MLDEKSICKAVREYDLIKKRGNFPAIYLDCEEGKEWDLKSLPAWKIEFEDGHKMNAYPEEIYLKDMLANGYKPQAVEK